VLGHARLRILACAVSFVRPRLVRSFTVGASISSLRY
jgi:hypothetical protein